jgi:hypothetical protein
LGGDKEERQGRRREEQGRKEEEEKKEQQGKKRRDLAATPFALAVGLLILREFPFPSSRAW